MRPRFSPKYFGSPYPGNAYAGASFDSWDSLGTHDTDANRFTADDFVAITMLSVDAGTGLGRLPWVAGLRPLDDHLVSWPRADVIRIIGDGEWAAVQFRGSGGEGRNGTTTASTTAELAGWIRLSASTLCRRRRERI